MGGKPLERHRASRAAHQPYEHLILLIHGYNVPEDHARASCSPFAKHLHMQWTESTPNVGIVFWPGDSGSPVAPAIDYPDIVPQAVACAPALAEYIRECTGPGNRCHIVLIGHSLGCRLVLEVMKILSREDSEPFRHTTLHLFLLAPAVSVPVAKTDVRLRAGVRRAIAAYVFHSASDGILHLTFPPGQWVAEDQFFPEAVGRFGNPADGIWTESLEAPGFDHGDYWPSSEIAGCVAFLLGQKVLRPIMARRGPLRELLARRDPWETPAKGLTERAGPEDRPIGG